MLDISWDIQFKTEGKKYQLALMAECEVVASVDNLVDTATIVLPEAILNDVLNINDRIKRGSEVTIKMGYNDDLKTEFVGYVKELVVNDSSLKILCEDALFLFRNSVPDVELNNTNIVGLAQYLINNIDTSYKLVCDYGVSYEKFTIHQATAYDVLKKLQDETKGNIYFNTDRKELHIHPPYVEQDGVVYYSMQKNVESSSLEYKNKDDYKLEVTVESTDVKGNVKKVVSGSTGGDKITLKVGAMSEASMQNIASAELLKRSASAYEGSFDTWLVPFVAPTYSARIKDEDYPSKTAFYYVKTVTTNLSASGGVRSVELGVKLGNG